MCAAVLNNEFNAAHGHFAAHNLAHVRLYALNLATHHTSYVTRHTAQRTLSVKKRFKFKIDAMICEIRLNDDDPVD